MSSNKLDFLRYNELVCLINRTCNFRTEVHTEPCEKSKMELFCENS